MKIHEFDPVIYPCKLWVNQIPHGRAKRDIRDVSRRKSPIPIEFAGAMTFSVRNKLTHDLGYLVAFKSSKRMTVNIIAHESRHVGDMLFERIGEDPQHSESACYFTGWVAECIDKVKKGK